MRLEKDTFGPVLRASRERRGITLAQIAAETKLGIELWADLEDNNLARWPTRIYARSHVRDYALRVGLDAEDVVNEFCRLFPEHGDRRAAAIMRAHAAIVNHDLDWQDLPTKERRRDSDRLARARPGLLGGYRTRIVAASIDLTAISGFTSVGLFLRVGFWPSLAVAALGYNLTATLLDRRGFGSFAADRLNRVISAVSSTRRRLESSRAAGA
jgi:Helix-turn-helix domain